MVGIANPIVVYFLQDNHGSGYHPNEDIKVFKRHLVCDHLYTIHLSMYGLSIIFIGAFQIGDAVNTSSASRGAGEFWIRDRAIVLKYKFCIISTNLTELM